MNKNISKSKHIIEKKEARPSTKNSKVTKRKRTTDHQKTKSEIKTKNDVKITSSKLQPKIKSNCEKHPSFYKNTSEKNAIKAVKNTTHKVRKKIKKKNHPEGDDIVKRAFKRCNLEEPKFMITGAPLYDPARILGKTMTLSKVMKRSPILQTEINMPPGYYRKLANRIDFEDNKKERSRRYLKMAVSEMCSNSKP